MADHVGIGEVENDEIVVPHARQQFIGHFEGAHLRFQVVGGDLWRGNQFAVFAGKRFLDSAVKKVSYMRVFLRLSHAQLRFAGRAHHFA